LTKAAAANVSEAEANAIGDALVALLWRIKAESRAGAEPQLIDQEADAVTTDDWRTAAACKGRTDVMFTAALEPIAKKLCAVCPVKAECLVDALATETVSDERCHAGVRAGMNPNEFVNYRRRARRRARRETENAA